MRFSRDEMLELLSLAEAAAGWAPKVRMDAAYRNQVPDAWDDIDAYCDGVIPATKLSGGHADAPLNGKLRGIFFGLSLQWDRRQQVFSRPQTSPFGSERLLVHPARLAPDFYHLYFADFYCYGTGQHYVRLVSCRPQSVPDHICRSRGLPRLDPFDNAFFCVSDSGSYSVSSAAAVWVELVRPERLDVRGDDCDFEGRRCRTTPRLPAHAAASEDCPQCNLEKSYY